MPTPDRLLINFRLPDGQKEKTWFGARAREAALTTIVSLAAKVSLVRPGAVTLSTAAAACRELASPWSPVRSCRP